MNTLEMVTTEKLGNLQRSVKKELAHLHTALMDGETVVNLATGDYRDRLGRGLLALTDRRVMFVEVSGFGGKKMNLEDFALGRISSVATQRGQVSGTLTIHTSGNSAEIHKVMPLQRTDEIAQYIRERISGGDTPATSAPAQPDVLSQLAQLSALKDAGALTAEEFDTKKAELLARL